MSSNRAKSHRFPAQLDEIDMGWFDGIRVNTHRLDVELNAGEAFRINRPFVVPARTGVLHDHDFCEVFWIQSGSCRHFINGQVLDIAAGHLCFVRPPDQHMFIRLGDEPCRMINIAFSRDTADHLLARYREDFEARFFWTEDHLPARVDLDAGRFQALNALERQLVAGKRSLARIECFLLEVMTGILGPREDIPQDAPAWLAIACEQIRDPEALRVGVSALVKFCDRSHEHVSRTFRQVFGLSPSSYVNRLRLEVAARNLAETNLPIIDIAMDTGIEDLSHFYKLFRAGYGISPMKYRKQNQVEMVQPTLAGRGN
jgi:AraC family transcriptional regulator, dual regulator of chb operon